jgi:hypothetical protein
MPDRQSAPRVAPLFRRKRVYAALVLAFLSLASGAVGMWRGITARNGMEVAEARVRAVEPVKFGSQGNPRYRTQVEVTYEVNGKGHLVPLSIPEVAITQEQLDEQLMRYRAGATVRVLYDPKRTDDIELEFAEPMRSYVLPLALLATGLALLMYVFVTAARDGAFHCASCGTGVPESHAYCLACGKRIPRRKGKMAK